MISKTVVEEDLDKFIVDKSYITKTLITDSSQKVHSLTTDGACWASGEAKLTAYNAIE